MQVEVEYRHKSFFFLPKENLNHSGYTCLVKKITMLDISSDKITISGQHQGFETDESVVGLAIKNQLELRKFPGGFGKKFRNLKYFEIDGSSISVIRREDFLDLGHLQGFWMPRNQIVALPNDLFINVQGLRYLSFHQNKLKFIGSDLLKPLLNLMSANFTENTTIDYNYTNGNKDQLEALKHEIITKCTVPKASKLDPTSSAKVIELEGRIAFLESKVKKLENEREMQAAKLTQVAGLAQMVEILQARLEVLETLLQ